MRMQPMQPVSRYVIWQMDKVNMSVAILPMAEQMGWDSADEGRLGALWKLSSACPILSEV